MEASKSESDVKLVLVGTGGAVPVVVIVVAAGVASAWWERVRSARLVGRSWNCIFGLVEQ